MIALENVSLFKPGLRRSDPILLDATATFGSHERVGILAKPGSGKSSIARLLSGIDKPDEGTIDRRGRVNWPIGFAGFLHPHLTVGENIGYFARLVGISPQNTAKFCVDFCANEGLLATPMQDITPTQRLLLSYACSMSVDHPSMWIADEIITVGAPAERKRCDAVLKDRLASGGLVFLSRNVRQIEQYCDRYYVLLNSQLIPCDDLSVGQRALDLVAGQQKISEVVSKNA